MIFFRVQLANFGKHEQPTSLCFVLTFGLRKLEQRNFFLAFFGGRNWQDLSRIAAYSTFQNRNRGGQCKVPLPLIKKPHL